VVGQDRTLEYSHAGWAFRVLDGGLYVLCSGPVYTSYAPPRVPSDVGVQLEGVMGCHSSVRAKLTPGGSPGITNLSAAVVSGGSNHLTKDQTIAEAKAPSR